MTIPDFKPSKRFLGDTWLACLFATVKNSELRGIATKHIEKFKEDPKCKIYLRGVEPKKITPWQQQMLEQLFEKDGLAAAVTEGMKEFEADGIDECYSDYDAAERQFIKENTYLPYLTIWSVVIDDIGQRVLISADTVGGTLAEHGATIYLHEGRWRFEDAEHLLNYRAEVTADWEAKKAAKFHQKWKQVLSPSAAVTQPTSDVSMLFGVWRFDPAETETLLKRYGTAPRKIKKSISPSPFGVQGKYFSPARLEELRDGYTDCEFDILGGERSGNWFKIQILAYFWDSEPAKGTWEYWCDGKLLVSTSDDDASVYARVEESYRKGDMSPERKKTVAQMEAWRARKKERMAESDKTLKAEH